MKNDGNSPDEGQKSVPPPEQTGSQATEAVQHSPRVKDALRKINEVFDAACQEGVLRYIRSASTLLAARQSLSVSDFEQLWAEADEFLNTPLNVTARKIYDWMVRREAELDKPGFRLTAISQGGLGFWSGQATDFLTGRQACLLIASASLAKSKRRLQAHRQRIRWRPVRGHL